MLEPLGANVEEHVWKQITQDVTEVLAREALFFSACGHSRIQRIRKKTKLAMELLFRQGPLLHHQMRLCRYQPGVGNNCSLFIQARRTTDGGRQHLFVPSWSATAPLWSSASASVGLARMCAA